MIEKFDYLEPSCPLSGGKDFYYPKSDAPLGHIPVSRIIEKVDMHFDRNEYPEAGRLLEYWKNEAVALRDKSGQLAMESELIGYYRKQNDREKGLISVKNALNLVEELEQDGMASGATIFINCATAYKAFDMAADALPLYKRAEDIYKRVLTQNDSRFGGLYNNMALALVDLGKFDDAEKAYFSAISVMEKIPQGEAECAISYINIAHMNDDLGNEEKALLFMEKAYFLLKSEALPRNGYYAFVLEKCAPSFEYFGRSDICEQMKREAKEIYERA